MASARDRRTAQLSYGVPTLLVDKGEASLYINCRSSHAAPNSLSHTSVNWHTLTRCLFLGIFLFPLHFLWIFFFFFLVTFIRKDAN